MQQLKDFPTQIGWEKPKGVNLSKLRVICKGKRSIKIIVTGGKLWRLEHFWSAGRQTVVSGTFLMRLEANCGVWNIFEVPGDNLWCKEHFWSALSSDFSRNWVAVPLQNSDFSRNWVALPLQNSDFSRNWVAMPLQKSDFNQNWLLCHFKTQI